MGATPTYMPPPIKNFALALFLFLSHSIPSSLLALRSLLLPLSPCSFHGSCIALCGSGAMRGADTPAAGASATLLQAPSGRARVK